MHTVATGVRCREMIAPDYSDGMIKEAKKGEYPANLTFVWYNSTAECVETE